jgi:hypothetical protein
VVVAPAGAGKSFFSKLLALRQLLAGRECIAVDPENEYARLAEVAGGQVIRLAASSGQHLNPFDLPPPAELTAGADDDPLADRVAALVGLLTYVAALGVRAATVAEALQATAALGGTRRKSSGSSDSAAGSPPFPWLVIRRYLRVTRALMTPPIKGVFQAGMIAHDSCGTQV